MKKLRPTVGFLSEVRGSYRLQRARQLESDRRRGLSRPLWGEAFTHHNNRVLESLCRRNRYLAKRMEPLEKLTVPKNFCFIEDAKGTVDFLLQAAAVAYRRDTGRVLITHRDCENVGLGAEGILSILARTMYAGGKNIQGVLPRDVTLQRKIWAIGTPRHLGVSRYGDAEMRAGKLRVLRHRSTALEGFQDLRSQDPKGKAIEKLLHHLNDCIESHGVKLQPAAEVLLIRYLGEVIGNAEEHAGMVDWTVMGYLDNMCEGVHTCEISLFNFGTTIAETFQALPANDPAKLEVTEYVARHREQRLFGKDWSVEDLLTVVAMQGHISCKKASDPLRGNGTVEAISVFQELSKASLGKADGPKVIMSIVSGSTQILFDGTYSMSSGDGKSRKIIAFNEENDLSRRPDGRYVRSLGNLFLPATVISIRFPLLPQYVRDHGVSK